MDTPDTTTPAPAPTQGAEPSTSYLEEKAFKARTLLVFGTITDTLAADVARRLIALDAESAEPIDMLVSSPGGHLESGDTIHDLVRFITAPVNMIGTGWVGSAATHLYLAAPRERRFCLPNTRFLIHQPSGGAGGPASDIAIQAREMVKARERIAATIADGGEELAVLQLDAVHAHIDLAHVDLFFLAGEQVVVARDVGGRVADVAEEGAQRAVVVEAQAQRADGAVGRLELDAHVHGNAQRGVDGALDGVGLHDGAAAW